MSSVPFFHPVAQGNGGFGKLQVFPIAGRAVQLHQPHVVGGANGRPGLILAEDALVQRFQITGNAPGDVQKRIFAGYPLVQAGRGEQVAEIVLLKVVHVAVTRNAVFAFLADDLLGGQVPVGLLGFADQVDVFVQLPADFFVAAHGVCVDHALHQLVEIPVPVGRAPEFAFA